jgi:hypothetical protein
MSSLDLRATIMLRAGAALLLIVSLAHGSHEPHQLVLDDAGGARVTLRSSQAFEDPEVRMGTQSKGLHHSIAQHFTLP